MTRRLAEGDWAAFRDVRLAALRDAPEAFGSTAADAEQLDEAAWRARLTQRAVFVAEVGTQRVGLVAGIAGEQTGAAELVSMWVAPAWRGHGVGDRLVDVVLRWAADAGFRTVHLWVAQGNAYAGALYARHGFTATGQVQPMGHGRLDRLEFEMCRGVG